MNKKFFLKSGFTLIELLLVIAIIGLFASASFIVFNKFSAQQGINVAYDEVRNTLAEAKSNALSQVVIACQSTPPAQPRILIGYEVVFSPATDDYSIYEICKIGNASPARLPSPIKTIPLPSGIDFVGTPSPIRFLSGSGGVQSAGFVRLTNTTREKRIDVTSGGLIQ